MTMTMTTLLSIDPGLVTGLSWGYYDDKTPYTLTDCQALLFDDLSEWIWNYGIDTDSMVIERFIPQSGGNFTLKEDDLVGVQVIGLLRHCVLPVNEVYWRTRSDKTQVPDKILKDHGLWKTGKDVNWTDGRDVNDSISHAIGHLAFTKQHRPTLETYFRG